MTRFGRGRVAGEAQRRAGASEAPSEPPDGVRRGTAMPMVGPVVSRWGRSAEACGRGRAGAAVRWMRRPVGRGESGGAVSLWVVLMVPISAFAAVVAMAGPQRLAAESSMREAADDMATMAVAWRYTHQQPTGPIPAFPPECDYRESKQQETLDGYESERDRFQTDRDAVDRNVDPAEWSRLDDLRKAEQDRIDAYRSKLKNWRKACDALFESVVRDLGNLGVDVGSLRGFYSDSLEEQSSNVPCQISPKIDVKDAVHVALVADWDAAGWAAAQVWPDGRRLGAESIGRRSRAVDSSTLMERCTDRLDVLDDQGRPVVLQNPSANSRQLSDSSQRRTALSG